MHPTLLLLLSLAALAPALPMNQAEDTEYASYKPYAKYTPYSSAVEQEAAKMDSMPMPMHKRLESHSQAYGSYTPYTSYGRYPASAEHAKRHMPMGMAAEERLEPAMMRAEAKRGEDMPSEQEMSGGKEGEEKGGMLPDAWYGKYTPYSTYSPYGPAVDAQAEGKE